MAQRISRAKQRIKTSGVAVPHADRRRARRAARRRAARALPDLQRGLREQRRARRCSASDLVERGDPARRAPCTGCCPTTAEVAGLLALMLLTDARRARADRRRRRADPARRAGSHAVGSRRHRRGRRADLGDAVRAAPSARTSCRPRSPRVHDEAARAEDTDWPQILGAVRPAQADVRQPDGDAQPRRSRTRWCTGPSAGLRAARTRSTPTRASPATTASTPSARTCSRWPAIAPRAIAHYRSAAGKTTSSPERNYLLTRAARLGAER